MSGHAVTIRRGFAEYDDDTEMVVSAASRALDALLVENQRLREKAQAVIDSFATTGFVSENEPSLLALIALREALAGDAR